MSKPTTIKEALKRWEEKHEKDPTKEKDIGLQLQWPPIEKMDNTLGTLEMCEKLSLSTNMIEKITGINTLKNLKILGLSRNSIKNLSGIEVLGTTLEQLWISYNFIEKTKPLESMKALNILYIGNNLIKDWAEFARFSLLSSLEDLLFVGNPIQEAMDDASYKAECIKRLPLIKKFDGEPVIRG